MPPWQFNPRVLESTADSRNSKILESFSREGSVTKLTNRSSRVSPSKPLSKPVSLAGADTLRVTLTTKEGSSAKRPHQAFLLLQDTQTGLDISYPFTVKENGKSRVELVCDPRKVVAGK
jgi:hypothetical protein